MHPIVESVGWHQGPQALMRLFAHEPGAILLESARLQTHRARYSFVAARPFLIFRSLGARCEITTRAGQQIQFGDPWKLLDALQSRYELLDELDLPFPLGGAFGYWGYDLKNFVEPRLSRRATNDLEIHDCVVGFHDSVVVFDHETHDAWIVSTGLQDDGTRRPEAAREKLRTWQHKLKQSEQLEEVLSSTVASGLHAPNSPRHAIPEAGCSSSLSRKEFIERVEKAQRWIHSGDIYQVNLSHRLTFSQSVDPWGFYQQLSVLSPAPFAAYLRCEDMALCSSSPELFLRMSGSHMITRPIKGTRPRSNDPIRDAQLGHELQTSPKERAELVMITDLLRNDLGRVCEYGSIRVPELMQLERYAQVQHLVSTVEGNIRSGLSHFQAFALCFPGGSITGAPKIRAMQIIDELEPVTRGPYTGVMGYLGFNRESQLSILIRTAVCQADQTHFHVGAGIVSDSHPEAEYEETLAKSGGFQSVLQSLEVQPLLPPDR